MTPPTWDEPDRPDDDWPDVPPPHPTGGPRLIPKPAWFDELVADTRLANRERWFDEQGRHRAYRNAPDNRPAGTR